MFGRQARLTGVREGGFLAGRGLRCPVPEGVPSGLAGQAGDA